MKLSKCKEIAKVALFMPIRSAYFDYKRWVEDPSNRFNLKDADAGYREAYLKLDNLHIPYHIVDEDLLAKHGGVDGSSLVCGLYKYDYLVIPAETKTMDKETEVLLRQYVANGGKVLLLGEKPTYLEGFKHEYDYLNSDTTLEEIIDAQEYKMSKTTDIISGFYEDENSNKFIYALNLGEETDIELSSKECTSFKVGNDVFKSKLHFDKYESKLIYFSDEKPTELKKQKQLICEGFEYKVSKPVDNFIILDNVQYSKDGVNYTNSMNYMAAMMKLIENKYNGDIYLKYNVNIKDIPSHCAALIEDTRTQEVRVNGKLVEKVGTVLEKDLWKFDIAKALKEGINEIIVKINFFEQDIVHYALFGENVTESIKNCLAYDTTIEAIYLMGDFGIYGDLEEHEKTYVGDNFYIGKQQSNVKTLIEDGYPFFRGNISLEKEVELDDTNFEFVYPNRFQTIDLYVNDKFVDRLMFNNKVDISKFVKKGKNKIRLDMVISNRNLLGPHHLHEEECTGVGPYSFELVGLWDENGQSKYCLKRYSFVKVL